MKQINNRDGALFIGKGEVIIGSPLGPPMIVEVQSKKRITAYGMAKKIASDDSILMNRPRAANAFSVSSDPVQIGNLTYLIAIQPYMVASLS